MSASGPWSGIGHKDDIHTFPSKVHGKCCCKNLLVCEIYIESIEVTSTA